MQLNPDRLEAFGGAHEVARHLACACSSQARRNLLCILLDCCIEQLCSVRRLLVQLSDRAAMTALVTHQLPDADTEPWLDPRAMR